MEEEYDFICTSIRKGQVELGCHIDEKTGHYLPDTVYLVIFEGEDEEALDYAYGAEEIYEMVRCYTKDSPYYKSLHACMQLGHTFEWV